MQFTLVSTIYNEAERLEQTISDIKAQTLQPDEIIITDAGSTDGSVEILKEWQKESDFPVKIIIEKGCNVARGRNLAIEAAKYELIASTDFGCRFHPEWLNSIITPFIKNNSTKVVGGSYTVIENEIKTLAAKGNYILSGGYQSVITDSFIPSSRSIAYKKDAWSKVGKYPEWLTLAADDLVFGLKIKANQIPITLVNKPYVFWGRHKKSKQYSKEAYRYGLGDGEANVNFRNFWSNVIETFSRYIFLLSIFVWLFIFLKQDVILNEKLYIVLLSISLFSSIGLRSYLFSFKNWINLKSKKYNFIAFLNALLMLEQQRISYIKGYIKGYWLSSKDIKQEAKNLHQIIDSKE